MTPVIAPRSANRRFLLSAPRASRQVLVRPANRWSMLARRLPVTLAAVLSMAVASAPSAQAADCPGAEPARVLLDIDRFLESVIVDGRGRLFFTDNPGGRLLRLDRRGAAPRVLASGIDSPGGMAFDDDGTLFLGYGDNAENGLRGDLTGPAGLLRVNPDTGARRVHATGLAMANGLARAPDGTLFASNDFGRSIDRIRNGRTERLWAEVVSGNGLVVDASGRFLYVAQTFVPAAVQRVEIAHPERVTTYVRAAPADASAGLDGMTRDEHGRLFIAANGAGEVWRVDRERRICVLARMPRFPSGPSAVAFGTGAGGFSYRNLYVVTFGGELLELPGVRPAREATPRALRRIRLLVRPRRARVGRRTRFRFRATTRGRPVRGARVRFAGVTARTNARGTARIVRRFRRPGRYRARATRRGFAPGRAVVVVRRARARPRFTG